MWLTQWLGTLIRAQVFDVNNGNEDKADLVNPANYDLENTQNFYFRSVDPRGESDRMGGWFISPLGRSPPLEGSCSAKGDDCDGGGLGALGVGKLTSKDTVFILLHGNAKNRGASHRIAAYKIFQSFGYYTLTMDYRGYGDSIMSFPLNETTVVEDAVAAIRLVRDSVGDQAKLIIYGHSMGTGIASHASAICQAEGHRVDGIILDSPFHSMRFALTSTVFGRTLNYIFDLEKFMEDIHLVFDTPKHLATIPEVPVRVFHAVVDPVCPIEPTRLLVKELREGGKTNIDMVEWEQEGLGHIGISKTPSFPAEIKRFANDVHARSKL